MAQPPPGYPGGGYPPGQGPPGYPGGTAPTAPTGDKGLMSDIMHGMSGQHNYPQGGQYPPQGYYPGQGGYPPQPGYGPPGYPPQQGGGYPPQGGYAPPGGYPPQGQPYYPPHLAMGAGTRHQATTLRRSSPTAAMAASEQLHWEASAVLSWGRCWVDIMVAATRAVMVE
ncbi:hypothetical protein WJX75_007745 [Coccomyxa subellipsoidea]|uniref:Rhodopsin n=1 Tax=Coccomyxa subellipsoidea TaxID=248742 RepID=A0ABR2YMI9_9CHLO